MWRSETLRLARPSGRLQLQDELVVGSRNHQQHPRLAPALAHLVWPTTPRAKPLPVGPARGRRARRRRRSVARHSRCTWSIGTRARFSLMWTAASPDKRGSSVSAQRTGLARSAWRAHSRVPAVPATERTQRRAQLTDVIRRVLRSTPSLCYYQVSGRARGFCTHPADRVPRVTTM